MGITTNRNNEIAMNRNEALELIKESWNAKDLNLEDKIIKISELFYSVGLDIATCANYIGATPAEFDAFLSLSNLSDDIIKLISDANPPKTTWSLLASGNDDEIKKALSALSSSSKLVNESISEFIFQQMIEIAGETKEQKISQLTGGEMFYLASKAKNFNNISQKKIDFLNSLAGFKKRGKVLTERQLSALIDLLNLFADNNVIQRNSIDGDEDLCNKVLDALDR